MMYGRWIRDTKYLLSATKKLMPTGLVPYVQSRLTIPLNIIDDRVHWTLDISSIQGKLEPYQQEVLSQIQQKKRCIVCLPTGSGKTYMYSVVSAFIDKKVAIVVPAKEVLDQVERTLREYTNDFVVFWGPKTDLDKRIVISTAGTLAARFNYIREEMSTVEVLFADEAHYYGANSFFRVSHLFPRAHYRVGFSATPVGRSDKADLRVLGVFSPEMIYTTHKIDRIVPVSVVFLDYTKNNPAFSDPEDYEALLKDRRRIQAICWIASQLRDTQIPFLIFVDRLELGEKIAFHLQIPFVTANSNDRGKVFQQIRENKLIGAVTTIGHTGLDIPVLMAIINTVRDTTPISLGQRAGRVMRKLDSKNIGVVFDFLDRGRLPARWASKRMRVYQALGFSVMTLEVPML